MCVCVFVCVSVCVVRVCECVYSVCTRVSKCESVCACMYFRFSVSVMGLSVSAFLGPANKSEFASTVPQNSVGKDAERKC